MATVPLGQLFSDQDAARLRRGFDEDRATWGRAMWRPLESAYQTVNCDPLITWPAVEEIIRHPQILDSVEALLGGAICLSEACLRHMAPYEGEGWRRWHRDRPHWQQHPLRTQYIHALVYLANVDETTHCFSLSPEAADAPILDQEDQLARGGTVDLHGPAGTVALFNLSVLHTATIRPTQQETQNRPDLLRTPRPTLFEQLHDPARSALARPSRPGGPRLLLSAQSQVAGLCRSLRSICRRVTAQYTASTALLHRPDPQH